MQQRQREEASLLNSFTHQSGEQQSFSQTVVRELALAIKVRIYALMTLDMKYLEICKQYQHIFFR